MEAQPLYNMLSCLMAQKQTDTFGWCCLYILAFMTSGRTFRSVFLQCHEQNSDTQTFFLFVMFV